MENIAKYATNKKKYDNNLYNDLKQFFDSIFNLEFDDQHYEIIDHGINSLRLHLSQAIKWAIKMQFQSIVNR